MEKTENPLCVDVTVLGGGLAGLSIAVQLKRTIGNVSVTILEKTKGESPIATHKVGESTVEIGAHYFAHVLGLKEHLEECHLPKLGLRYFYGGGENPIDQRPELGSSVFSPVPTYQIDRGILENHLRKVARKLGVQVLEGVQVTDVDLPSGQTENCVVFESDNESRSIGTKWVVDATGRRRLLQRKLVLGKASGHNASSVWFRVKGKLSVSDLAHDPSTVWKDRNVEDRYLSTNHLMGHGYWVWLIPLSSGNTSVGIVSQDDIHDFITYSRNEQATIQWLAENEPFLASELSKFEFLDFKKIKAFSYSSDQLFSMDRWTCVGEAGVFTDPFYSPGSDLIAISNSLTTDLISKDLSGGLIEADVEACNQFVLDQLLPDQLSYYKDMYHVFGNATVSAVKFLWDTLYYWNVYGEKYLSGSLLKIDFIKQFSSELSNFCKLNEQAQALFNAWAKNDASTQASFEFIDLATKHQFIRNVLNLVTETSSSKDNDAYAAMEKNLALLKHAYERTLRPKSTGDKTHSSSAEYGIFNEVLSRPIQGLSRKKRFASSLTSVGNGALLYSARNMYIKVFVKDRRKPLFFGLLKTAFPA